MGIRKHAGHIEAGDLAGGGIETGDMAVTVARVPRIAFVLDDHGVWTGAPRKVEPLHLAAAGVQVRQVVALLADEPDSAVPATGRNRAAGFPTTARATRGNRARYPTAPAAPREVALQREPGMPPRQIRPAVESIVARSGTAATANNRLAPAAPIFF